MLNPTWLYTGFVYAAAVALARRCGVPIPRRVALFFYSLAVLFLYLPMTHGYASFPVDFVKTLPPWTLVTRDNTSLNAQMNDLALQIVPWAHQVREGWKALSPPLWNERAACGYPLLASAQSSALAPLRLLGLPLSLSHAITFEAGMKILIALTFMYLWCRRRGYSEIASSAGAVAFGFSTFIVVWLHFPLVSTACFVPAIFYVVDLLAERVTATRFAAGAVIWAFMLFGGHPETVSHAFFLALLYIAWIVGVERTVTGRDLVRRFLPALVGAIAVAGLLAAPMLAPFAESVTKSKRFHELASAWKSSEVPFSDLASSMLLITPNFFGEIPGELRGPAHAESVSGFAGTLGIVAWFAVAIHVVRTRRWRSREAFFVLATIVVLGIVLSWPGVSDAFHTIFRLAANARMRLGITLFLAILTAAAVDLLRRDRTALLAGLACGALLLLFAVLRPHANDYFRDNAVLGLLPGVLVIAIVTAAAVLRRFELATLLLLAAVTAELFAVGRSWNPAVDEKWMYPKTPLLEALDGLKAATPANQPFRIVGAGATFFPNLAAIYGFEDVRAHDPMANGRYIGLLRLITNYDSSNYFATWGDWDKSFLDYLNVRYVLSTPNGELPPHYRVVYDGFDGKIFENTHVLPRFYAVRNVIIDFVSDSFVRHLREDDDWANTALLDRLDLENEQMRADFFTPRPPGSPLAVATIVSAKPTDYRLHVRAPRYSLVVSSIPYWPGWKVLRNGARVEPIRVNGGFLGFAVAPGELDVRVWYDPWTFRLGWIVALVTALGLVIAVMRSRSAATAA